MNKDDVSVGIILQGDNAKNAMDIKSLEKRVGKIGATVLTHNDIDLQDEEKLIQKLKSLGISYVIIVTFSSDCFLKCNQKDKCIFKDVLDYLGGFILLDEYTEKIENLSKKSLTNIVAKSVKDTTSELVSLNNLPEDEGGCVLVLGSGITGLRTSLALAKKNCKVYLVEKEPYLGGNSLRLCRTYPNDSCTLQLVLPILSKLLMSDRVKILSHSEVKKVERIKDKFRTEILEKAIYVNENKCNGCGQCLVSSKEIGLTESGGIVNRIRINEGECTSCGKCYEICDEKGGGAISWEGEEIPELTPEKCTGCFECKDICPENAIEIINICPVKINDEFNLGISSRSAIFTPFLQEKASVPIRDPESCLKLNGEMPECKGCYTVCPTGAIKDEDEDQIIQVDADAIVLATGFSQIKKPPIEYNYDHANVISQLEMERILSPFGPTEGEVIKASDKEIPKVITFVQCVGSRDRRVNPYCSRVCCMNTLKQASLVKDKHPEIEINVCYIDMRAAGRFYEEYYDQTREKGVNFVRGNVGIIEDIEDRLVVQVEDTISGEVLEIDSDLVVLAMSLIPNIPADSVPKNVSLAVGADGFLHPTNIVLSPTDSTAEGIFFAGTCTGPKSIKECVSESFEVAERVHSHIQD